MPVAQANALGGTLFTVVVGLVCLQTPGRPEWVDAVVSVIIAAVAVVLAAVVGAWRWAFGLGIGPGQPQPFTDQGACHGRRGAAGVGSTPAWRPPPLFNCP